MRWLRSPSVLRWVLCGVGQPFGAAWLILLAMWLQHWIVSARPGYNAGPGGGLGIIMMTMFALGVAIGTAAFGVLAAWWKNK